VIFYSKSFGQFGYQIFPLQQKLSETPKTGIFLQQKSRKKHCGTLNRRYACHFKKPKTAFDPKTHRLNLHLFKTFANPINII